MAFEVTCGTYVVIQGTAANLLVTSTPSGTQTTLPTGTLAVSQAGAPWSVSITTQGANGASIYLNTNVGATGTAIKTAAGNLYGYDISLTAITAGTSFVKLYNKATAPTGTDTPVMILPFIAGTAIPPPSRVISLDPPIFFSLGIGIRATATNLSTDTAAPGLTVANIWFA